MEIWEVVGVDTNAIRTIKAENKKIYGISLYLIGDAPAGDKERILGRVVREQFISNERRARLGVEPMPGDTITLIFNRWGDIEDIQVANSAKQAQRPYGSTGEVA